MQTLYVEKNNGGIVIIKNANDLATWNSKGYKNHDHPVKSNKMVQSIISYWKTLTWKEYMDLLGQSIRYKKDIDGNPVQFVDGLALRQNKIAMCLKKWDLKDDEGNDISVTPDNINQLPAEIANEMVSYFEQLSELSSDDMKHIEESSAHFFRGQGDKNKIPDYESIIPFIYEHIIARTYKIHPYQVREMSQYDFNVHLRLCIQYEYLEKEFKANLAGAKSGKGSKEKSEPPRKGGGTKKVMNSTKLVHFTDGRRTSS